VKSDIRDYPLVSKKYRMQIIIGNILPVLITLMFVGILMMIFCFIMRWRCGISGMRGCCKEAMEWRWKEKGNS
jgi:hypothetical protein